MAAGTLDKLRAAVDAARKGHWVRMHHPPCWLRKVANTHGGAPAGMACRGLLTRTVLDDGGADVCIDGTPRGLVA